MGQTRQKIRVGEFEIVILNYEVQKKVVITVLDKNSKVVGKLRVSGEGDWIENFPINLPINPN